MNQEKYIGMDVHDATISAAVKNAEGKLLMECVLETKAATILEFIQGLRGTLALTFEEGTLAAIGQAIPAIRDRAVIEAKSTVVKVIVQLIRSLREGIADLDERIEEAATAHLDFFI